jgi:hypothetical protein
MPRRISGLMGYVGEVVVEYWLKVEYPEPAYSIAYQIKPIDYHPAGGPYLDFGVIKDGKVHAIYEVKSADYIFDCGINGALDAIWNNPVRDRCYSTQDDPEHHIKAAPDLKAYLVLLVCPNEKGIKQIGQQNLKQVILFSKVFEDLEKHHRTDYLEYVHYDFDKPVGEVIEILKNPKQGKSKKREFLRQREACQ